MVTAYTKMLLGMLQNRVEARLGQMIDVDRVLEDAVYASAVLSLARGTLNGEIRLLASLLWPLVNRHLADAHDATLKGIPPYVDCMPQSARVIAFPRQAHA